MRIKRRTFLSWFARLLPAKLAASFLTARASPAQLASPIGGEGEVADALQFLVIGDWGRKGQDHQRDVAVQMGKVARLWRGRFVISAGDNFYDDGVTSSEDPQWQTSFQNVYAAPSLQVPWYCVLGNHDYQGQPEAQLEYARRHPRWRMPARYYTLVEKLPGGPAVRFYFIDTSPFVTEYRDSLKMAAEVRGQDTDAQLRWLDQALEHSDEAWKIVVGHHPIYSGGEHGTQAELVDRLLPLLQKHRVPVYVNGHDHDLQHLERDGMHFFTTGAGSQVRDSKAIEGTRFARGVPGFLAVSLSSARLQAVFYDASGALLHEAEVRPTGT